MSRFKSGHIYLYSPCIHYMIINACRVLNIITLVSIKRIDYQSSQLHRNWKLLKWCENQLISLKNKFIDMSKGPTASSMREKSQFEILLTSCLKPGLTYLCRWCSWCPVSCTASQWLGPAGWKLSRSKVREKTPRSTHRGPYIYNNIRHNNTEWLFI